jgi:hypothetical protein
MDFALDAANACMLIGVAIDTAVAADSARIAAFLDKGCS